MFSFLKTLYARLTAPILGLTLISIVMVWFIIPTFVSQNVEKSATRAAKDFAVNYLSMRDFYIQSIISQLYYDQTAPASVFHRELEDNFLTPENLEFLQRKSVEDTSSISVDLTSPYPFTQQIAPLLDPFQQRAWEVFKTDPERVYTELVASDTRQVVRVAVSDVMRYQACIDCHNVNAFSSKTDWQMGDVSGIVAINYDVTDLVQRGQLVASLITAGIVAMLVITMLLILHATRSVVNPVRSLTSSLQNLAHGNASRERIQHPEIKELKALSESLEIFQRRDQERNELSAQMRRLAYYDSLSNLPNRTHFKELLENALELADEIGSTITVVLIDVDRFQEINDTLGHQVGDHVLKTLARRLADLDIPGLVVAHLGEDEFALLLSCEEGYPDDPHAGELERIRKVFCKPFDWDENEFSITACFGVTHFCDNKSKPDNVMSEIDIALNRAKSEGPDSLVFYEEEFSDSLHRRVELMQGLRTGLKNGELRPYFQPQFDLQRREMVGAEALIRWIREDGSFVSPGEFIPLAESSGLIEDIGKLMLDEVCRLHKGWQDQGMPDLRMAVNVSAVEFARPDFVDHVAGVLKHYNLKPSSLELEITETAMLSDIGQVIRSLTRLGELGVELAIDDFGTGYSSLSVLRKLPVHRLKIDRSFVVDMTKDKDAVSVIKTIVALGRSLDLSLLAEGVEYQEEEDLLKLYGCHEVQGFFYARPMPADDFLAFWKQHLKELEEEPLQKGA
ncbi:EAL domain-containing protein [Kiloniella sp. b19]|uniref:EAL domain-containing protein n=1 Tax=Kiloniella sp. GXU_MW_B19 TaxID=3141326 RepID=UPI0031E1AF8A